MTCARQAGPARRGRGQDTRPNLAEILSGWKADYTGIDVDTLLVAGPPRDTVAATSTRSPTARCRQSLPRSGADTLDPFSRARRT